MKLENLKLFFLCILLLFCSCQRNLNKYKGFKIEIPRGLECVATQDDTIAVGMCASNYKYIIFVDSLSCSSCSINQLPRWLSLVNYATDNPEQLSLYFIFESKKEFVDFNRKSLFHANIYYPLFLDTCTMFRSTNSYVVNGGVNSFMIDSANRVVLVGDILKSKRVLREFNGILMNNKE